MRSHECVIPPLDIYTWWPLYRPPTCSLTMATSVINLLVVMLLIGWERTVIGNKDGYVETMGTIARRTTWQPVEVAMNISNCAHVTSNIYKLIGGVQIWNTCVIGMSHTKAINTWQIAKHVISVCVHGGLQLEILCVILQLIFHGEWSHRPLLEYLILSPVSSLESVKRSI